MDQVRRAFEAGHHDALVGSCESIASNAQMLCMGTLDVMWASHVTYKTDMASNKTELDSLKQELISIKTEYNRHMMNCSARSERFDVEKQVL